MKKQILIDKRNKEDILNELSELSKSYTPEWNFDTNKPDIGTTIATIYANQVSENIENVNQIIDRYHAEFINLLDISINPATPAKSIVLFDLIQDTIGGALVAKGTRLLSQDAETFESVIFETTDNIYVTGAKIDSIFMTDRENQSIYPVLGEISVPEIIKAVEVEEESDEIIISEEIPFTEEKTIEPFKLFGEVKGVGKNAILFYHSCIFDIEDNNIYVRIEGNKNLVDDIAAGRKYFVYASDNNLVPVESVKLLDDGITFALNKHGKNDRQLVNGKEYALLAIIDDGKIEEDVVVSGISFSATGEAVAPDFVGNDITEEEPKKVAPFGTEISLYQDFFIGHDEYFKKAGSKIELSFELSFLEKMLSLTLEQEEAELKIIKKKPTTIPSSTAVDVYVQKLAIEYFNGIGWKKIKSTQETSALFSATREGKVKITFTCPSDWEDTSVGTYNGRMLRFSVLGADNCYMRPSLHHYPVMSNIAVAFSYEDQYVKCEEMKAISSTKEINLRNALNKNEDYVVFSPTPYSTDALYIGLNTAPVSGPVSMFIRLAEGVHYDPLMCEYEYSTLNGFRPLKVIDGTYNMTRSGLIMFIPPSDFAAQNIEGNNKFYIRIRREQIQDEKEREFNLPIIEDIKLNGVVVENIDTYPEQDFYLDEVTVGAKFTLSQHGILDTEVWVNETDTISSSKMKEMLSLSPQRCRVEYDILGNVSSFYVLWDEVERFEEATHKRVYELDRLTSTIIFGNGIDTDIPRMLDTPALRVKVRCTLGDKGNVEINSIDSSLGNLMYIGDIYNPVKGYGGSAMETVEDALRRGSNIISNRRRLVSMNDYVDEIKAFSDRIDKVRCISGEDINGNTLERALSLVVLMKDFADGSYSFHEVSEELKKHILDRCSITISPAKLFVVEPIFVKISVTAWVLTKRMQEVFEIQNHMNEVLKEYLDPVTTLYKKGWRIGTVPTTSQIQMKINSSAGTALIKNISVVASFSDANGYHETDLNELKVTKRMVAVSGKHQIHVDI